MTTDEIKQAHPMPIVLEQYGIQVRHHMCSCPWHEDRHPSMRVYKDGAKCFSCGWSGDIFALVQKMEHCDFKTAFYRLGGSYQHTTKRQQVANKIRRNAIKDKAERQKQDDKKFFHELCYVIDLCRLVIEIYDPYSDLWCECQDALPFLENAYEAKYLNNEEVNDFELYRKCRQIRQRILA